MHYSWLARLVSNPPLWELLIMGDNGPTFLDDIYYWNNGHIAATQLTALNLCIRLLRR